MKEKDIYNLLAILVGMMMVLVIFIGYLLWLDSGCAITGVMTWQGKVCI